MAQTTGAMTGATGKIEVSTDGSTWYNISGSSQSIDAVEFTRLNGSAHTFEGDYAVLTFGKQPPTEVTVNILYTEVSGEAFLRAVSALKNNTTFKVRWQAMDIAETTYQRYFTAGTSKVASVSLPGNDASSGEPLMVSFTVICGGIDYELVVPAP